MANPFQDQLLKAGLVDKKKVNKVKVEQRAKKKGKNKQRGEVADEIKSEIKKSQQEKAERDRQLNRQRQQEAEKNANAAQIKQLVEMSRQPTSDGELAFNFTDQGKVKTLYVTAGMQSELIQGYLAVVKLGQQYDVVPRMVAEKICSRDEAVVVLLNERQDAKVDSDDPYADYQVPDDLMW